MKNRITLLLQFGVGLFAVAIPAAAGTVTPIPEPASLLLIGGGLGALILLARRKRSQK